MKVFISWSGECSHSLAEALRDWLPDVIQAVEPFLSSQDIMKGARWGLQVARELEGTSVGIICLTPDNLNAPWILFETGALSKIVDQAYICTYLFKLKAEDLISPLADFQATKADSDDTYRMLISINTALGAQGLPPDKLKKSFDKWWDVLEEKIKKIPDTTQPTKPPTSEEISQEVNRSIRTMSHRLNDIENKFDKLLSLISPISRLLSMPPTRNIGNQGLPLPEQVVACNTNIGLGDYPPGSGATGASGIQSPATFRSDRY
jgi:hypothetical protein